MAEELTTPAPQESNVGSVNNPTEKKYTQEDLETAVENRLIRERKLREKDPDYKAFKQWQQSQQTEAEKQAEKEQEYNRALNENALLKAEKKVISADVKPEFSEFVTSKVLAMGDDFEKNLADYKKNNPHFFGETVLKKMSSSPSLGGTGHERTTNERMNELIRGARNNN